MFMSGRKNALLALCLSLTVAACLAWSIESEPVKVTHRNSGPRYDLSDPELDHPKLTPVPPEPKDASDTNSDDKPQDGDQMGQPIGHVSIRRIFLVPMMRPMVSDDQSEAEREREREQPRRDMGEAEDSSHGHPGMFAKPFWPFITARRPSHIAGDHQKPHLFGADEASRSPTAQDEGAQRPAHNDQSQVLDPIQMMLEMMQQAINNQMLPPQSEGARPSSPDLNKEAASDRPSEERPKMPSEVEKSDRPANHNETREDIVEIEGKKYLRKTVINRHVGPNIIFMTRRLIFSPLNETDKPMLGGEQPSISTTSAPKINVGDTTSTSSSSTTSEPLVEEKLSTKPIEEAATSSTTTTTEASAEPSDTVSSRSEQPSSTVSDAEETTPSKESILNKVEHTMERLIDGNGQSSTTTTTTTTTSTTTEKPTVSS